MAEQQRSRTIIIISFITIAASLVVMTGWIFNIPVLKQIIPGFVSMVFNTALCFVLFSAALLLTQYAKGSFRSPAFIILSLTGTFIGLTTLLQFLFHFNTGIDELFVRDKEKISASHLYAGRMAFNASINVFLFGLGLLMLTVRRKVFDLAAQWLFHIVTFLSAIALIGYLYGASLFYSLFYVSSMATHTAILFFILSLAAALLNPSAGIAKMFTGNAIGSRMGKRLFVLMLIPILLFGSVRVQTQHFGFFSLEVGISLLAVSVLLICLLLIWDTATRLNKIDEQRSAAETEIKSINADLEKRVEQRSAEFLKSEEKYRLLIEHASDAIYVVDFKGNFMDANASMCNMIGYSRDELLEMNVEDIIDPEELKVDPVKHGPRNPGEYVMRERLLLRKDGSVFNAEVNVKMFQDDRILVIARDITGRKKMETELREAEVKFRTIADKSMVGVYISQGPKFIYVNPRFAEIFGYEPHELINTEQNAIEMLISEDYQYIVREKIQARYSGELDNAHYEAKGKKKDGTTNWVEFYGNRVVIGGVSSIIGTMLDITERKLAEEVILREKMLSETIINSLPEVFYLRNEKGEFLRWNKNFEKFTGYTPKEIRASNARLMIAEEDREIVKNAVERINEEDQVTLEARVISKNGNKIPFLITITSIIYESQPCVLGIAIDITERLKAEEELRSSELKYKLLFESNPLPLWMIAKDSMTIIAVNETAARLYGYSREELINKSVTILRPPDDQERKLAGYVRGTNDEDTDMGLVKHLKKDGTAMYVQIIANDIVFEGREVRLSFTNDITEKLKAEESLHKSEANLQTIFRTTNIIFSTLSKDLEILAFNPKAAEFVQLHYKRKLEKGQHITDYMSPERAPQVLSFINKVLSGKAINYEIDYRGHWYNVSFSPIINDQKDILGMLLTMDEITERKNAEQNLKDAYDRIQTQINSIKGMAWKQSHLMRSPLANLKALADLLKDHPADTESLAHFQTELDRLDAIIHEMAQDASDHVV